MHPKWPADRVERRPISSLLPYARNARTHSDAQVAQIAASMKEWGWTNPVLVDEAGMIIAGHGRVLAARKLNLPEVPVMVAEGWSESQKRAYVLADNQLATNAGWDDALLKNELSELQGAGFDLDLIGFSNIDALLADAGTEGLTDPDEVPEAPARAVTVQGDTWILGKHRLRCGDSTSVDDVTALMNGEKADLSFTSPPYNANAKAGQGDIFNRKKSVKLYMDGYSDNLQSDDYIKFAQSVLENCFLVTDGFIFWNVSYNAKSRSEYIAQIVNRLPYLVEQVCWKKSSTIPFKGSLMRDWEPIYIFSTNRQPLALKEVTSNFWQISNTGAQADNHKACFPVALPEKGMSIVAMNSGIVFEPFCGSGTTVIAAENCHRRCFAMELDARFCDVAIKRWQDFTGQKVTLESDGQSFDDVAAQRYDWKEDGAKSYDVAIAEKRKELVRS